VILADLKQLPEAGDQNASRMRLQYIARQGLTKHAIATQFGGHNNSFQELLRHHEALGKCCLDTGLMLSLNAHLWGTVFPLLNFGNSLQQKNWLQKLLDAELIAGHAITEVQAGSDINALQTTAIVHKTGYLLKGRKRFITNTPIADLLIIYAQLDQQLSAFIVCRNDSGVYFTDAPQVSGCRSATMGDVILEDCLLPENRLLGKAGNGKLMIQQALELERAFIFAGIAGIMAWQLEQVITYSRQRKINQEHLGKNQAISHKIAEMKLRLDTIRLWLQECARLKDQQKRISLVSAETKLYASEAFLQSCLDSAQILGASGLLEEQIHAQLVQDAMASRLFSGTSEIQKNIIAALSGTGEGFKSR